MRMMMGAMMVMMTVVMMIMVTVVVPAVSRGFRDAPAEQKSKRKNGNQARQPDNSRNS